VCFIKNYIHIKVYILFYAHKYIALKGGEKLSEGSDIGKALCRVFAEIAEKEKRKAIQLDDYVKAFIAAIFEGLFKEAERSFR